MEKNNSIYFASTNENKKLGYKSRLGEIGWHLEHVYLEMPEDHSKDVASIATEKIIFASDKITHRPLFVEDRGLVIDKLGGYPNAHIKELTDVKGIKTIYPFIGFRSPASFIYAIAYMDINDTLQIFEGYERGFIIPSNKDEPTLRDVFCYETFPNTPLSELNLEQMKEYKRLWEKHDAMAHLIEYLKAKK